MGTIPRSDWWRDPGRHCGEWWERGGGRVRRTRVNLGRCGRAVWLGALLLALTGCSASQGGASSPAAAACDVAKLAVTVDEQLSIHVKNTGAAPCRFAGDPAVQMKVGRVDGPLPSTDVKLLPGQEFVQPQVQVPGKSACSAPTSGGLPGMSLWTVTVDGVVIHPPNPNAPLGRAVVNCWVVTLPPGRVVVGSSSAGTATDAQQMCERALGVGTVLSSGPVTTVGELRSLTEGPGYRPAKNAFPGVADSSAAAYCWTKGASDLYDSLGVTGNGESVRLASIGGVRDVPSGVPVVP